MPPNNVSSDRSSSMAWQREVEERKRRNSQLPFSFLCLPLESVGGFFLFPPPSLPPRGGISVGLLLFFFLLFLSVNLLLSPFAALEMKEKHASKRQVDGESAAEKYLLSACMTTTLSRKAK